MQKEACAGRLQLPKDGSFEVQVRRADGTLYPRIGRLNFSDVRVSPTTGTREVRAELPNAEGTLRPGEFVRVVLRGAVRPNAITVPQRAVLEGPQGKFVYVIDEAGKAQPRPVQAGEWAGESWIITSGIQPGERVIVDGVMKLGPGAPVRIAEGAPAAQGATQAPGKPAAQPQKPAAKK
jgi:membrane fusion protein, multidrug efflux system